jgi:hypothetical protein
MFDSKSPVVKITGYIVMGFITIVIIISFGMPDFISRMGFDQNTVVEVNGDGVQYIEYVRFRDNFANQYQMKDVNNKEFQKYIVNALIENKLQTQKARSLDISVSEGKIKNLIRDIYTDKTGAFNNDYYERYLKHYQLSRSEYFFWVRDVLVSREMVKMIDEGMGVPPDEVLYENAAKKSAIQVKYCYISHRDLKKRYQNTAQVSYAEIEEEISKNPGDVKDPKTDRERIKTRIEDRKIDKVKMNIVNDIDREAAQGMSFDAASAKLGGAVGMSNEFKIGEPVKDIRDKAKSLAPMSDSKVFSESCLALAPGRSSKVINTVDGLYVFTPVKRQIKMDPPSPADLKTIEKALQQERVNSAYYGIMTAFKEKSKIFP